MKNVVGCQWSVVSSFASMPIIWLLGQDMSQGTTSVVPNLPLFFIIKRASARHRPSFI